MLFYYSYSMKYLLWFLFLFSFTSADYVSISHLQWEERYEPATYAYNKCMDYWLTWAYSCEEMLKTFISENAMRNPILKSATNDHWICQLNYRVHSRFISSDIFKVMDRQIDYCVNVWVDASKKGTMPRYANKRYDYKNSKSKNQRLWKLRNSITIHKERNKDYIKQRIKINRKLPI